MVRDRLVGKDVVKKLLDTTSDQMAWRYIRALNGELEAKGHKTLRGKVSLKYLIERYHLDEDVVDALLDED